MYGLLARYTTSLHCCVFFLSAGGNVRSESRREFRQRGVYADVGKHVWTLDFTVDEFVLLASVACRM